MLCDQVRQWMPLAAPEGDLGSGDLGHGDARRLSLHLAECPACAAEMVRWRAARFHALPRPAVAPEHWSRLQAAVLARVAEAGSACDESASEHGRRAFAPREVALPLGFWDGFHAGVLARIAEVERTPVSVAGPELPSRAFAPREVSLPEGFWDGWSLELAQRIAREPVPGAAAAPTAAAPTAAAPTAAAPTAPVRWGPGSARRGVLWFGLAASIAAAVLAVRPWSTVQPVRQEAEAPRAPAPSASQNPSATKVEAPWSVRPVRGFALDNSVRVERAAGAPGWSGALDVVRPLDARRPYGAVRPRDPARGRDPAAPRDFPLERSPVPSVPGDRAAF